MFLSQPFSFPNPFQLNCFGHTPQVPLLAEYADSLLETSHILYPNSVLLALVFVTAPQVPLLAEYAASLRTKIIEGVDHPHHRDTPLKGLKIVVDAGNGSGGFFADQVRQGLEFCGEGLGVVCAVGEGGALREGWPLPGEAGLQRRQG
jgi:hypothetical protein